VTRPGLTPEAEAALARARRLEWWTLGWLASIVVVMGTVMGSSEAMQAAWVEDLLSLAPPALFLLALKIEGKGRSEKYPFGLYRTGSLCFLVASVVLAAMGGYLVYDAAVVLIRREHPTIGTFQLLGQQVWLGWVMIAALVYSVIPPVILGRKKRKLAPQIADQVLHTDAEMNAADWKTGLAGVAGILGIAMGWWWADAAAAGLIGLDILRDGLRSMRGAVAELLDGAPRRLDDPGSLHPDVARIEESFGQGRKVRVRETGRYLRVEIGDDAVTSPHEAAARAALGDQFWRIVSVTGPAPGDIRRGEVPPSERGDA
jgi:divalent metal cation (Fe/Co/Zn/Cd) transporter